MNTVDSYDIGNYSDTDLYNLLDLVNPTDRVLEARLIQLIHKYSTMHNSSGDKLANFFKQIYDHFFDIDTDDDDDENTLYEGLVTMPTNNSLNVPTFTYNSQTDVSYNLNIQNPIGRTQQIAQQTLPTLTANNIQQNQPINTDPNNQIIETKQVAVTRPVDYSKDKLNPLLKQTVRRIISIDSQYRDTKSTMSTEFTFNLSEPLINVVRLSLYSVQIPYTWYTINTNYGGNFFYLKGSSPGIDTGDFDYKISIPSGNYSPVDLITAINSSFKTIFNANTDVSFSTTGISYNASTSLSTLTIDLQHRFDETDYQLQFADWSAPNETDTSNNELRYKKTLAAFLGFNNQTYEPNTIYSQQGVLNLTTTNSTDDTASSFTITASNESFNIIQYMGPNEYDPLSTLALNTITITLSPSLLTTDPLNPNKQTRTILYNDLNTQLLNSPYLVNSYIERIDISSNATIEGFGHSYYAMHINLNKKTTLNTANLKTVIVFPTETTQYTVWAQSNFFPNNANYSCFLFKSTINELNNIVAETESYQTNYVISSRPYMVLRCIEPGYIDPSNTYINDPSYSMFNDVTIFVPPTSQNNSYSLSQYQNAINNAYVTTNTYTTNPENPNGIFNIAYSNFTIDANTSLAEFKFDISKVFTTKNYILDLSNSYLFQRLKIGANISGTGNGIDLSQNTIIISTVPIADIPNSYIVDTSSIAVVRPKQNFTGRYATPWDVSSNTYLYNPLSQSSLSYVLNLDGSVTFTLIISVQKVLTQTSYQLLFYDPSSNGVWNTSLNSWYQNLKIPDQSYNLIDVSLNPPYSYIRGSSSIYGYTYTANQTTYITLKAKTLGVSSSTNTNDITITIPAKLSYTRQDIFAIINNTFANDVRTSGSSISTYIDTGGTGFEYIKFRLNINKIYTSQDYRIVFYDPYSFVACINGIKNATWDSTLGWILGYRKYTEYYLSDTTKDDPSGIVGVIGTSTHNTPYIVTLTGDTTLTTNLYNYFLIVLDDYTQSHLNDGLVTITNQENDLTLPSYASRAIQQCDPKTSTPYISGATQTPGTNALTQAQIYSANQINSARTNKTKNYSLGPYVQDIFGIIPMKTSGLANGGSYIEFGGTLQNQDRTYFGPVNIRRMTIRLVNDRGDNVDLNGSNWSFSLVCEQLYQQTAIG